MSSFLIAILWAVQTDAECLELARKIEASVRGDGGVWVDKAFDLDLLLQRSYGDAPGDPKRKAGFGAGIKKTFNLGKQTAEAVKENGSYRLLRVRTVDGRPHAVFRMLLGDSFNYHEYLFEAAPGGGARIADLYPYIAGEWLSETFGRAFRVMLASDPKGGLKDNEYMKNLDKIQKITALREAGKPAESLKLCLALPAALQKDKSLLLLRCLAAMEVGPKESLEAIEAMKKHYPGDPSLALFSLGPYTQAKRYDEAHWALDALEKATGGDAYLHGQRAEIHLAAGEFDQARASALEAIKTEKTLDTGYWAMVTVTLQEKKYADTVTWLTTIEKELKVQFGDFANQEPYAGFVKSPEFAAWMKARGKK